MRSRPLFGASLVPGTLRWGEAFLEGRGDRPLVLGGVIRSVLIDATSFSCSVGIGEKRLQARPRSRTQGRTHTFDDDAPDPGDVRAAVVVLAAAVA